MAYSGPEIKPCPFCGGEAEWDELAPDIFALCCSECQTIGPHCDGECDHETAAKWWNCRGPRDWNPPEMTHSQAWPGQDDPS